MRTETVLRAGHALKALLIELGASVPERASPHRRRLSRQARLNHLLFMATCIEVLCDTDVDKREKAMRWMCFIQGTLWAMGRPIHDMKLMNWSRTA